MPVGPGEDIVCTSTNVRETGKIELKKDLSPDNDPGRFNLLIKQGATSIDTENNAGEGGTTGENTVNTGTYQVSETAGTTPVTDLDDYQKSIVCKAGNGSRRDGRDDRPRLGRPARRAGRQRRRHRLRLDQRARDRQDRAEEGPLSPTTTRAASTC